MNGRAVRARRGGALAATATLIAATAHTLGGGVAPSPMFCLVLFALATPFATAFAVPRPSLWRTAAAVGVSQALFHAAFTVIGDPGWSAATGPHVHGAAAMASMGAMADAAAPAHADMTLAHVLAALATILLVRHGQALIAAIRAWIIRAASTADAPVLRPRAAVRTVPAERPPASRVFPPGLGRRGPPRALPVPSAA
ncbi:hypothetical protein [Microbacterium sp. P05]|uniref:hypothetical protein n=1 Tax=Microbacterium sp. P05 TaxID=3366948 RepID=UPI00374552C3